MEKKRYYKDGMVEVFRDFSDQQWEMMSDRERLHWTPLSEDDLAPIPKEVIEFKEKEAEVTNPVATEVPDSVTDEQAESTLKEDLKAELKERGIYFHPNSKLETLKKKLADANDTE